jgi:hypothetical protein
MLSGVTWTARDEWSEAQQTRALQVFSNWQPPDGFEFKAFYVTADGSGGMAIVEVTSPAVLLEATAPFTPFFAYTQLALVEVPEAVAIFQRVIAWRDSVS